MPMATREEQRAYQNAWMQRRRRLWLDANGPCRRCGSFADLEVDHVDPDTKISHRVWSWTEERRVAELAKCQVLCRMCHEQKTLTEIGGACEHGTRNMYRRYGCRCDLCRIANTLERRRERSDRPSDTIPVAVLRAIDIPRRGRRDLAVSTAGQLAFWQVAS